ncbi:penicillin-binding protein 2 [Candidatus Gracilibacteria bacterium]|nr:penicillin-binding protein 2 [Candidatus Gracilibacteria bacterium]
MNPRKKTRFVDAFFEIFDRYPREYFVYVFFLLFFGAIIWETFSYTVINYGFYNSLAYNQQVGEVEIPVTRGTLYSAATTTLENGSVFGTSVDLNDLAIDPQIKGDKGKLGIFLTNLVYKEICYLKESEECYNDMLRFLKVLEINDFNQEEEYLKGLISKEIVERISKTKVTAVRLKDSLSPDEESQTIKWGIKGVYPGPNGLYVNPEELVQVEAFVEKYIDLFGGAEKDVLTSIRKRDLRYIPIYRKLSLLASDELSQYISDENQALSQGVIEDEDSIGGFMILNPHAQRIYPERDVASQLIGFIDSEGRGHYGIEGYFDDILKGSPGEKVSKKDTQGRTIDPISLDEDELGALEGANVYTTIDRNIQKTVEQILEAGVKKYRANKGTVVVMDPHTGKILSMANYPNYDPNNPGDVYDLEKVTGDKYPNPTTDLLGRSVFVEDTVRGDAFIYDGKEIFLREADRSEYGENDITKYIYKNSFGAGVYQNDAISSLYEPGSIMKAITVAVGIDTGEIKPYDMYNDEGKVSIDSFTISNVAKECLGYNTYVNALNFSCNVGMIRIVQKIGRALLYKYYLDFGFAEETGITLSGEVSNKIEPYERWSQAKLLTSSYGLGVAVTPLQMASAYSVIANGGVYMKPYLIEKIEYPDGRTTIYEPEAQRRVLKESSSEMVIDMLVDGVENGVAKAGGIEGFTVAGKTGTSQIAYKGGYEGGAAATNGSFVGFAPAEDPQVVVLVKLERPRSSQYGGSTSSFIFADITREILEYYGIPKKVVPE